MDAKSIFTGGLCAVLGFLAGVPLYLSRTEVKQIHTPSVAIYVNGEGSEVKYVKDEDKDETSASMESTRQTMQSLYGAHKAAAEIREGLEQIKKTAEEMRGHYEGTPGLPGKTGIGDLFPGPGYKDIPGLPEDPGFGKLFPGPGKKDDSDEQSNKDAMYMPARELTKVVEDAIEHIQSDVKRAYRQLNKINKHMQSGRKALETGKTIADSIDGNVPSVPDIPRLYEDNQKKEEEKK